MRQIMSTWSVHDTPPILLLEITIMHDCIYLFLKRIIFPVWLFFSLLNSAHIIKYVLSEACGFFQNDLHLEGGKDVKTCDIFSKSHNKPW